MLKEKSTPCPDCGEAISLAENLQAGAIFECENCGCEIEIQQTEPLKFEAIEEEK